MIIKAVSFNKTNGYFSLSFIILFLFCTQKNFAQYNDKLVNRYIIGIQTNACVLPNANIKTIEGNYHLRSALQSSFSIGVNYQQNFTRLWGFGSGLRLDIIKRNFFLHIPDSDLPGYLSTEGAPQIESKEIYPRLVVPIKIIRNFNYNDRGFWDLSAGINVNYSGFSEDVTITTSIADSNFQLKRIFYGDFTSDNNKKAWITFNLGTAKSMILKNNNLFAVGIFFEWSFTDFIEGEYEITVPNKPLTRGIYKISGSLLGLSIKYAFTGINRKLIKKYQE